MSHSMTVGKLFAILASIVWMHVVAADASADFVVRVGDGSAATFTTGSVASIPVYIQWNTGIPQNTFGFSLAFDLGTAGVGHPGFTSVTVVNAAPAVTSSVGIDTPFIRDFDFGVRATNVTEFALPETLTHAFTLQFNIAPELTAGVYSLAFKPSAIALGSLYNNYGLGETDDFGLVAGTNGVFNLTVSAVPEPFLLARLSLCGLVGTKLVRRRRALLKREKTR